MRYSKMVTMTFLFVWSPVLLAQEPISDSAREAFFTSGRLAYDQGNYSEARRQFEQLVEISRKVLGSEHPETLTAMGWLAGMLAMEGSYSEARELEEEVVEVRTRTLGAEHPSTLTAVVNLAGTLKAQGDLSGARQHLEQVVEVLTRILGAEHPDTLRAVANLAGTLLAQGDLSGARQREEQVVKVLIRILGAEHPDTLTAVANLAQTLKAQGHLSGARQYEEQIVEVRTRILGTEHPDTLMAVSYLAGTQLAQGDLSGARQHFEQVKEVRTRILGAEHPDTLTAVSNLAETLRAQGDLSGARQYEEQVVEVLTRILGAEHPDTLTVVNNLAETLFAQGDLSGARQREEQVMKVRTRILGAEHPDTLTAMNNLAGTLFAQRDLTGARQRFEQVVEARTRILGAEHPDTLTAVANLAATLKAQGDLSGARQREEQVVEVRTRILGAEHPGTLTAVAILAETLFAQGDLSGAQQREEQVVAAFTHILGAEHPDTLKAMHNLAFTLKETGDVSRAQHLFEKVVESRKRNRGPLPGTSEEAESLFGLGQIHRDAGRLEKAREMFLPALEALEDQVASFDLSEVTKSQFRVDKQVAYKVALEVALATKRRDEAFYILERYRAQSLLTLLRQDRPQVVAMAAEHQSLTHYYDRLTLQLDPLDPQADKEERTRLLAEQARVRRQLEMLRAERDRELGDPSLLHPLGADEVRRQLEPGTAMLAYYVTPERIHLFIMTRESPLQVLQLPVTAADLWVQARTFFPLVQTVDIVRPRSPSLEETVERADATARLEKGRWLFEHLIAPAFDHVKDADRLLILPDGPLYYLPFAAFVRPTTDDARGWQYLVEWKPLDTVQSATVYAELRKRRPSDSPVATPQRTLVALGDPSYPQSADTRDAIVRSAKDRGYFTGLKRLPNTRREVEEIGHLFEHPRIFLDADATEERAKAEISRADYVHFASHGFADPERPDDSFLALTIPEGFPEDRENGLLQAWEIIDHVHLDAGLVVLSACVTAFGPTQGGEGLMSLSRAFQIAGARTVAATLWRVDDESTAELMIRFYRHLLAGTPKDEALRLAQLDFIRGPITVDTAEGPVERDFTAPYYWAAFQLIGDWR